METLEVSAESIKNLITSESNFALTLINYYTSSDIKFNWHCLINNDNNHSLGAVNFYICRTLD